MKNLDPAKASPDETILDCSLRGDKPIEGISILQEILHSKEENRLS
jgi:hypothetical protein